jgi:hypothetical protein
MLDWCNPDVPWLEKRHVKISGNLYLQLTLRAPILRLPGQSARKSEERFTFLLCARRRKGGKNDADTSAEHVSTSFYVFQFYVVPPITNGVVFPLHSPGSIGVSITALVLNVLKSAPVLPGERAFQLPFPITTK